MHRKGDNCCLEIKDPLIAEALSQKFMRQDALDLTVVISFHTTVLQTIRALEPRIPTGWLIGNHNKHLSPIHLCQQLGELGSSLLNVNHQLITAEFAYEVQRRGITLWCWTVDDITRMREMRHSACKALPQIILNVSLKFSTHWASPAPLIFLYDPFILILMTKFWFPALLQNLLSLLSS